MVFIASAIWVGSCAVATVALWRAGRALREYEARAGVAGRQAAILDVSRVVRSADHPAGRGRCDVGHIEASRNRGGSARLR